MVLLINIQTLLVGFVFGLGMSICFFTILPELIKDIRNDDPDNEFVNSEAFEYLFKLGLPSAMLLGSTIIIGPLFGSLYRMAADQNQILNINPGIAFVLGVLVFTLLLDIAVVVSRTPFALTKFVMNTWVFICMGLLLPFLLHPVVQQAVTS